jgi:hypothetical protein
LLVAHQFIPVLVIDLAILLEILGLMCWLMRACVNISSPKPSEG